MNERTKRWIEAALDPQGKWYGRLSPNRVQRAAQDIVPMPEEETIWVEAVAEPEPWLQEHNATAGDEWEPA